MLSEKVREVARAIGNYYLEKSKGDYQKATMEVERLQITKIEVTEDNTAIITTGRPGVLIGPRGRNIGALEQYFIAHGVAGAIKTVEDPDPLVYYLVPQPPDPDW